MVADSAACLCLVYSPRRRNLQEYEWEFPKTGGPYIFQLSVILIVGKLRRGASESWEITGK